MAILELNPETKAGKAISAAADQWARYKLAKADYERAVFASSVANTDPADDEINPLSEAHEQALKAMMTAPAERLFDLKRKLIAFQDEELETHNDVAAFVSQLVLDARTLCDRRL
jgi:hypothetical protein